MSTSTTSPRHRSRLLALGGVAVPIALVASCLGATSASAAGSTQTTKAGLISAFQSASNGYVVTLGADLLGDGGASDVVTVPNNRSVTLDLNGHALELDRIAIGVSAYLTVTDGASQSSTLSIGGNSIASTESPTTGIQLVGGSRLEVQSKVQLASVGTSGLAGVGTIPGSAVPALLYIDDGATVAATGGSHAAGIGGGEGAAPLSTISIGAATVTATAGDGAGAIGGGYGATGTGSAVAIENGDVTLAGGVAATFSAFENTATGGATSTVRVASGSTLTVPSGQTLRNTGDLVVDGTLTGSGTIENPGGTIRRGASGTVDDAALTVNGRNHAVSFAVGSGTTTAPAVQHVYAATFADAGLDLGAYTGSSGARALVGWSSGSTAHVSSSDLLAPLSSGGGESDPVALTAAYERPIAFSGAALPNAATGRAYAAQAPVTGGATTYAVAANPASGLPADTIPSFPSGLAIDASTGAITGQPATSGHYSFVLSASSPHQQRSQAVTVDVAGAPVVATGALPDAAVGSAYGTSVLATSERGSITYAITAGALPSGLRLDPTTGAITGTPTSAGTATFTVSATNTYGTTDRALSLAVAAAAAVTPTGGTSGGGTSSGTSGGSGSTPSPSDAASTSPLISAPVLPILGTTTVRLGHALALSVAASSTLPVTYSVPAKELPAGVSLDRTSGLLFGSPRTSGRFLLHVTATSGAGTTARAYTVVVPAVTHLVTGSASAITPKAGASVLVTIRGLKAGERWRIALDGRQVQTGIARFGGSVKRSVHLPARAKDTTHRIRVSGSRTITDPSTTATHELTLTAVVAKKALRVSRSGGTLTVRGLAAKERVTIRRGTTVVASGRADAHGVFVTTAARLSHGTHSVTGSTAHRTGRLVVR